jgi:hypothetical protein
MRLIGKIAGAGDRMKDLSPSPGLIIRDKCWGWSDALSSAEAATVKELVALYLEEGRLNVKVDVKQVDQVRTQRG